MKVSIAMNDATHAKIAEDLLTQSGANDTVLGANSYAIWFSGTIPSGNVNGLSESVALVNQQIDEHSTALTLVTG